ncbi:MAG: 3-oxoacyl-[acyl-carrier-protein] reductase [Deltaproteobacteria bacterium]|nr:3-oxoacyl-[acyl-carrier-protein] reductase [Deltaproteobacteria bacterium]
MTARPQALITGGTRGIGRAICLELAAKGYDVAFTYRSNAELARSLEAELASKGARAKGFELDISNPASIEAGMEKVLAEFGQIETLVNNAGISIDGLAMRFKADDFDRLMDTNVRGAFLTTQAVLRPMMKLRRGSIIFISSVIGQMGNAGQAPYSATKAALLGLTKSLAREVGSRGIRVNAITPGFVKTDMTSALPEENKQAILAEIPLGTFGEPEDIAAAVLFLASPASKYVTGQVLAVNGGMYM